MKWYHLSPPASAHTWDHQVPVLGDKDSWVPATLCLFLPLSEISFKKQITTRERKEDKERKVSVSDICFFIYFLLSVFLKKRERPKPAYRSCHVGIMFLGTFNRLSDYFSTSLARWLGLSNFLFLLGLVAKRHSITSLSLMTRLLWSAKTACRQHPDMAYTRCWAWLQNDGLSLTLS